ncbi:MAG: GAF domain-containing protein [Chloroflexota bacterium]
MSDLSPIVLGMILLILGVGLMFLVLALVRVAPRLRILTRLPISLPPAPANLQIASHNEAVLLIQTGGRVVYINQPAREMFNLWEEEPNLESLARRARPSEAFLTLCATQGRARFSLNGRFVEGISYFTAISPTPKRSGNGNKFFGAQSISDPTNSAMLICLRRPQLLVDSNGLLGQASAQAQTGSATSDTVISNQAFSIFAELSQSMASSLDLEATLTTILEGIERLIPSDILEITIWDSSETTPQHQSLLPYRLVGIAGVDRHLEKGSERYQANVGYSGYLITTRKPLLVRDVATFRQARPALDRQRYPFQSFIGLPMLVGGELIGTLELASLAKDNYTEKDLDVLKLLAGQAGVAVKNALLYQEEQLRVTEMAGLATLAQAVSAIRDPQDLYNHLVESILPLIDAEMLGFLVYDENRRVLQGQNPFHGIPANVVEWYQTTIQPGSPAEAIWHSAEVIISTNAPEDPRLQAMELHHLAQTAGIRHNVLVPLTTGGRMLGYLQIANKSDGSSFDRSDLRLLSIIAGQAAPIIENATLVQESRHRAQRAETLRRIASLTSSSATVDEILKFSLLDLARLLQADIATIFLLDESRGELYIHKPSIFGIAPDLANRLGHIPIDDPQFPFTVTGSKRQFIAQDLAANEEILPLYRPLAEELKVRSAIDIPLVVRERGIGEIIIGSFRPNFFAQGDIQTSATAAGQLAVAIEQAALYSQTDQSLRQRVEQLTALTRISRELNTTLQLEPLLQRVYNEAIRTTRADCGTILLLDPDAVRADGDGRPQPVDSPAKRSSDSSERRGQPITLFIGDDPGNKLHPLELQVLQNGESIIVEDFEQMPPEDGDQSPHASMQPAHPGIQSALIVPIAYQGQIAGLIHLHARAPGRFGPTEREISESLAIQAAIALGNTQRYQEQKSRSELLNRRVETLSKLFEVSEVLQAEQPLEHALEAIAYAIQASTPFDVVLVSVFQPQANQLLRVTSAGIPLVTMAELRARPQPWGSIQTLLQDTFRMGRVYFIPSEQSGVFPADLHRITLSQSEPVDEIYAWHPNDILFMPLFGSENEPLGLISVDSPRNSQRPDRPTVETLEIFGSQAALIIESRQKLHVLRSQVDEMDEQLTLAKASAEEAQRHLPGLLHKDLEQTLSIQQLVQHTRRINAGLEIIEIVSQKATRWTEDIRSEVLKTLSQETLARMDFDVVLIAEISQGVLQLSHVIGNIPAGVNPKALLGQRNPLRYSLQRAEKGQAAESELLLVADLEASPDWNNAPLLRALEARSFICLPISNQVSLLAVNKMPTAPFTGDDHQLFTLMTRQVSVALQNIDLLEETTRRLQEVNLLLNFSRQLGSLDPISILQNLVETALSVVPAAQAGMVVLWDAQQARLVSQVASGYADDESLLKITYLEGEGLPGQTFVQRKAVRIDEIDFARHYNLSPENLLRYRDATGGKLPVSCLAVPIMAGAAKTDTGRLVQDETRAIPLGALVIDNAQTTSAFSDDDLAVITSLAQQTALTLENARLYQASEHRSDQLQALTDVATTVTSSLQPEELVSTLLDQLQAILPYDTGTLWLRQTEAMGLASSSPRERAVDRLRVSAARGFEDSDQRIGLVVDVQDSALMTEMINTGKPIWVGNVLEDPRFGALSLQEEVEAAAAFKYLSWLGIPLITGGKVVGVIALEKTEAHFYTPDDIQLVTTFAGQAAVGLENARLYQESVRRAQELDQRSQTLTVLNRLSSELSSSLNAQRILEVSIQEFAEIIPCSSVSVLSFGIDIAEEILMGDYSGLTEALEEPLPSQAVLQAEYSSSSIDSGFPYPPGSLLPETPLLERLRESQGIFSSDDVTQESELLPLQDFLARYHTHSLLIVPLSSGAELSAEAVSEGEGAAEFSRQHAFQGLLLAHNDQPYHYHSEEFELARTISNQIAIALQNAQLYEETRSLTSDLEIRVQQRTFELTREQQRVETLLRIITELSASLDLDQVLNSTLQVLSEYVDASQIVILIARPGERNLHRLASFGYPTEVKSEGPKTPLQMNQGLAGWIITQRQSVLIDDVLEDERWITLSYGEKTWDQAPSHHSAMGVPLMSGAEALGCLLLFHPALAHFSMDQLDLVQAAANQVAIAVNNSELYRLIRDQAEDLGTMLRSQQVETSRSKAILEAVADGVLVTDANRQITLFNESAEKILGLDRSQVLGKSLEQFIGLFGRAAKSWMGTITTWSQDANTYQAGDTYLERITLEDAKVISVHLSPVILRSDFLGTVSIFQDITHQVEVDRLKSEFVATVSHELRTPMTSIKGYVEILLMGAAGKMSEQQEHFLQIVKSNTERLAVLVNDLLDVSQIESGRITLKLQPMVLEEVVTLSITDLRRRSEEESKPIAIETDFQPNLPRVKGDPDRIRQVLDNLIDNAFQYNSPNGKILIRVRQVEDEVQIDVKDSGIGIHPSDLSRVFERFFRGENPLVLGVSGTGLGLSITQYLVEMHRGRIWVESTGIPGEGSTFSFTLPVYNPGEDTDALLA